MPPITRLYCYPISRYPVYIAILYPGYPSVYIAFLYQGYPAEHKPSPGEIRQIHIEKSCEQLGIKIEEGGSATGSSTTNNAGARYTIVSDPVILLGSGFKIRSPWSVFRFKGQNLTEVM